MFSTTQLRCDPTDAPSCVGVGAGIHIFFHEPFLDFPCLHSVSLVTLSTAEVELTQLWQRHTRYPRLALTHWSTPTAGCNDVNAFPPEANECARTAHSAHLRFQTRAE